VDALRGGPPDSQCSGYRLHGHVTEVHTEPGDVFPCPKFTYDNTRCVLIAPEAYLLLFFNEILVDSTLATPRIGEQKISCLYSRGC